MEKNKSIDGLKSRHSKNMTPKKTTTKTTIKKSVSAKPSVTKKSRKISVETTQKNPQKTPKNNPENITEDFLQPVQAFDFNPEDGSLTKSEEEPSLSIKKAKKEKKKMSKKKKIILSIIIGLLSILLIFGVWFIIWGNDILAKITGGQSNVFDLLFVDNYEPLKTDENGRTNILAFGTSGYNMEGDIGNGKHDGAQLTDSIMILSLNQETGDLAMLSLPRDLKASPTCTATGKINEVYWCNNMENNNEEAGANALIEEVENILGINIQYYAHINWGALVQIVDSLGGIKVTLDEDVNDNVWTFAHYDAGVEYTLNGTQALDLARARYGTAHGDFTRGASQQKILIGIEEALRQKNLSITDLVDLASTLGDNLRTNFSINEIKTLAHISSEFDFNNIRQVSLIEPTLYLTTGSINGISYVLPSKGAGNYYDIKNYITKMFSSDPRVYEEPTILILNGTEEAGLAASEKNKLIEAGYETIEIGDAPSMSSEKITLYSLSEKPGTKKLLEDFYETSALPSDSLPAGISQNYDFIIILGNNNSE